MDPKYNFQIDAVFGYLEYGCALNKRVKVHKEELNTTLIKYKNTKILF